MIKQDIENKKEIIQFGFEKKVDLEKLKQEFFIEKQKIMRNNSEFLWNLKDKYQDKVHTQQLERMDSAMKLKLKFRHKL